MAGVQILYEDQASGSPNEYGPHKLVCWLVWDRLQSAGEDIAFFEVRRLVRGNPKKGVDKVLAACREELETFAAGGTFVIALLDNDRVREHVGLPKDACISKTTARCREGSEPAGRLRVVLLEDKMETVLASVLTTIGEPPFAGKPTPAERDIKLARVCGSGDDRKGHRAVLVRKVPSLGYLVDKIHGVLRPTPSSSAKG